MAYLFKIINYNYLLRLLQNINFDNFFSSNYCEPELNIRFIKFDNAEILIPFSKFTLVRTNYFWIKLMKSSLVNWIKTRFWHLKNATPKRPLVLRFLSKTANISRNVWTSHIVICFDMFGFTCKVSSSQPRSPDIWIFEHRRL